MKFGIVCEVEGKTLLENGMTIDAEGISYIFYITEENLLKQIRIISNVDDPEKYFYYTSKEGTSIANLGYEVHIKDKLVREMQLLESSLALAGNIKRVYWDKPTYEYYPETTEEHARFNVTPPWFFLNEMKRDDPRLISPDMLTEMVRQKELFEPLVTPMAFYREVKIEYVASRYINAFFNSYFIIEGLFGNGKWKTEGIIQELTKSPVFTEFVQSFLDEVGKNDDTFLGMTKAQLEAELKTRDLSYTVEGMIKLLIKKRGELHHFSINSTKTQGHPLNNADYKIISLIAMRLATDSLSYHLKERDKAI